MSAEPPPAGGGAAVILLRHGRSTANGDGVLAGRGRGVDLDPTGRRQAAGLVERLAGARIARLVCSPQLRCRRTLAPLAAALGLPVTIDTRVAEVDYGAWTGASLADLVRDPLWATVQNHPSGMTFPGGESLATVSARAVAAVREHASTAAADGSVLVCTHGDVIKAVIADALGMHMDLFQRIVVSPASVSVVRYTPLRPYVERVNDTGSLDPSAHPPPDGVVGGDGGKPAC